MLYITNAIAGELEDEQTLPMSRNFSALIVSDDLIVYIILPFPFAPYFIITEVCTDIFPIPTSALGIRMEFKQLTSPE